MYRFIDAPTHPTIDKIIETMNGGIVKVYFAYLQ